MKLEHIAFSGSVPANYEQYLGPLLFEPYAQDIASRISKTNVQSVLEIACGTGRVTKHLRNLIPYSAQLIATDLNPGMLEIAKNLLPNENISFQVADAQELPFADNSFNVVVCQFGFMFVPDKAKAFNEAFRVLKQGGTLLFNTWDKIENNHLAHLIRTVVTDFFSSSSAADFYEVPFSMYNKQDITSLLHSAGFNNIHVELVTKKGIAKTALDAAKGLITGTPAFKEILERDASAPEKIITIAENKIAELYGKNSFESELNAWVTEAWK
jgi:ubiquinone/menaquinone biosynthesis C-methylase UbiE